MYSHGCRVNYILSTRLSDVLTWPPVELIEDIYFFEVNTQIYFIECVENIRIFTSAQEMKSIWYLQKSKVNFFYFILPIGYTQCLTTENGGADNAKSKSLANPNKFLTKIFVTF